MKVVIANFSAPVMDASDAASYWARHRKPDRPRRVSLFEQRVDWGFHIYSLGVYLMDLGLAHEVEFWDYAAERSTTYLENGVLRVILHGPADVAAYRERYGDPDLFVNHGPHGRSVLQQLEGRCFRVHVPALLPRHEASGNFDAECYLVDAEEQLDAHAMLYVPVVNTRKIFPIACEKRRDFVYLASVYRGKRHDLLLDAIRGSALTGHLHPVDDPARLDLSDTHVTTSGLDQIDVVELLRTSRIAVYPGDDTSNPAAMWECVAAGLPIVMNARIAGGKHLVVPGVTGELAAPERFRAVMEQVLADRDRYRPREHFERHWDTVALIESYLAFFERMGWRRPACS